MRKLSKLWLYSVLFFFIFHFTRDILQDLKVHTLISDVLVKIDHSKTPRWYWTVFNTYLIEGLGITFSFLALRKQRFGVFGYLTIFIAFIFIIAWLFYWFFL